MNDRHPIVTHEEIERYHVQARAMQSREFVRLLRSLPGTAARLLARLRGDRVVLAGRARCS